MALMALISVPLTARAGGPESRDFGLGIILGEPSGLTGKLWLTSDHALDFHLAYRVQGEDLGIYVDYLVHFYGVFDIHTGFRLPLYAGIGGVLTTHFTDHDHGRHHHHGDNLGLGVRIPLGVAMEFKDAPIEIFLEFVPGMLILPGTNSDFGGALGGRFYF
jgi:hypothetical protein